ncbi:YjiH family protein [Oceanirhabdus sp. W0125-5]|uniref:YjiH family protein n=1 Tax=Oceanirhabdus sp. W0125-5 TaxID=2999116 RepID=UPI0022F2DEAE|nr:YjiH family protein [Oceanirhabdus sp. W0125-5]WBW99171.1 YjiH family protein [Oceanirhabdus sp. W0125-5]
MNKLKNNKYNFLSILKFIIPSLIGIALFTTPIKTADGVSIPVALISNMLQDILSSSLPALITALITISAIFTVIYKLFKLNFISNNEYLCKLLNVSPFWTSMRIIGAIFSILVFTEVGPTAIISENTGGLLLSGLMPTLFCIFLLAGMLLPLLLDFGLMDLCGALMTKIMRPIFTLPGRASIDCLASWLGDGTIGVLLTSKQYEDGFYSKREAAVISTTFSAVSITFSLVVISQVGLSHLFIPYYGTVILCGVITAIIVPRIPPLSKIDDTYLIDNHNEKSESKNNLTINQGFNKALATAENYKGIKYFFKSGLENVIDMWLGILPVVMSMGTIALIIAEYTPVFKILGLPFIPLLNLLSIPEAAAASQTILVGFADMFIPSIIAANISSEMTRFIIAALSVTQLIYISEVGSLILGSKIPINFKQLFIIFIERTLISLPIIALVAHIIF